MSKQDNEYKRDKDNKKDNSKTATFFQDIKNLLSNNLLFQGEKQQEGFILTGSGQQEEDSKGEERKTEQKKEPSKKPVRVQRTLPKEDSKLHQEEGGLGSLLVDFQLKINKKYVEEIYSLPKNKDIVLREFMINFNPPIHAFAVFVDGLSDNSIINEFVLRPLMFFHKNKEIGIPDLAGFIKDNILPGNQVDVVENYKDIVEKINYGGTVVFIDGSPKALAIETKGWDRRSIGKPEAEQVIRGPHEAFNETLRSNTALIRKAVRNENLITEMFKIGKRNKTDAAIMYLEDLANPTLVQEVTRRIKSINTDYIGDTGVLEQFIEDHPFMIAPQILGTERPDRVASFLVEGKIAIIVDGTPNVLIVPTTFFSLLHSAEDYYLRMPYGNLVRLLRFAAIFISILTPGMYIAVTTFHQEMIPTDLILAIAASRQTVPFPTILEVFLMEFAFELIREAGVRIPGVIGNTLGIVGALILGQAAVQAGIVSPILIIVVAITGLASFAIPNYSMSFAFRGTRFIFTILAAIFGFFGISAGFYIFLSSLASMKSFGVPFLAPMGPKTRSEPDLFYRGPVWEMEERPDYLNTLDRRRQPKVSRKWTEDKGEENNE